MPTLGQVAIDRARAELRAVQEAALKLAILMAQFGQDAERLAAMVRELDAKEVPGSLVNPLDKV